MTMMLLPAMPDLPHTAVRRPTERGGGGSNGVPSFFDCFSTTHPAVLTVMERVNESGFK